MFKFFVKRATKEYLFKDCTKIRVKQEHKIRLKNAVFNYNSSGEILMINLGKTVIFINGWKPWISLSWKRVAPVNELIGLLRTLRFCAKVNIGSLA